MTDRFIIDVQHSGSLLERSISCSIGMYSGLRGSVKWDFSNQEDDSSTSFEFTISAPKINVHTSNVTFHNHTFNMRFNTLTSNRASYLIASDSVSELESSLYTWYTSAYLPYLDCDHNRCVEYDDLLMLVPNLLFHLASHGDINTSIKEMLVRSACLLSGWRQGTFRNAEMLDSLLPALSNVNCLLTHGALPEEQARSYRNVCQQFRRTHGAVQAAFAQCIESIQCFGRICTPMVEAEYGYLCDCCEERFLGEDETWSSDYREGTFCRDCYNEIEEENSYEDDEYDEDNEGYNLANYSTNVLHEKESFLMEDKEINPIFLGVELEVESQESRYDAVNRVNDVMGEFCVIKSDGSLDSRRGMEIVSVPATLSKHKSTVWKGFFESKPHKYLRGWTGYQCGMHVHIGRDCMSDLELGKLMVFINSPKNSSFIDDIAGRGQYTYCQRDRNTTVKLGYSDSTSHYDALSISEHTRGMTAELRIFRSNVNQIGFFKNLEFTEAAVRFAKQSSIAELDQEHFIKFVMHNYNRKQYQHLIEYLCRKGYAKDTHKLKIKEIQGEEG